ncbi:MAG: NAD-dependent deacylase [Bacteroidales bacterium]|nr:NAD-dependent deacylase [Bacteroidales bacterium]
MKRIVVLSGAGISAESGLRTFREMGGLWEEYDVMEVASPQAWHKNPELVMRFYNERRKQLYSAQPNNGHKALVDLEDHFIVNIITQNVDDLHERAGSSSVIHLHGELKKSRSQIDYNLIYDIDGWELKFGDKCEKGSQLRPHIVWFGEEVPALDQAIPIVADADILIIVGTSLNVYPAAGLVNYAPSDCQLFLVDPNSIDSYINNKVTFIQKNAGEGLPLLVKQLIESNK